MQLLQKITENNKLDVKKLAQKALKKAQKRVVIKRHLHQAPILKDPTHSYSGKSVCYDMYIVSKNQKAG